MFVQTPYPENLEDFRKSGIQVGRNTAGWKPLLDTFSLQFFSHATVMNTATHAQEELIRFLGGAREQSFITLLFFSSMLCYLLLDLEKLLLFFIQYLVL